MRWLTITSSAVLAGVPPEPSADAIQ